jgi:hypothetical protein
MMSRKWFAIMTLFCSVGFATVAANADSISFGLGSNPTQTLNVTAAAGSQVSVPVYLVFTGSYLTALQSEGGLFSSDVDFVRTASSGPGTAFGINSAADVTPNTADFNDPLGPIVTYTSSGDVDLYQDIDPTSTSGVFYPSGQIFLGEFTFTAGNAAGEQTTFTAQLFPGFADTVAFDSTVLDGSIQQATLNLIATPSVAAVPLPSTALMGSAFAIVGIGVQGFSIWRRRRLTVVHV